MDDREKQDVLPLNKVERKLVLYARVSRDDLNCSNQKRVLVDWALRNNVQYDYFQEEQTTRKTRPIKESIIKSLREGVYDTVVVVRIDRFARSLQELIMDIEGIINNGGSVLFLGYFNDNVFNGFNYLNDDGRFLGVRKKEEEGQ